VNTESWIIEEQGAAESEILALFENEPGLLERREESLVAASLEQMVGMIALQGVTGVASGFAGKLFYDKWRGSTTRRTLKSLAAQIPPTTDLDKKVNEEVIRRDVIEVLMLEGLSSAQAIYITERIVARVRSRSATPEV
jgi:hypothetical protein